MNRLAVKVVAVAGATLFAIALSSSAQPSHRIYRVGSRFFLENRATLESRPFDLWVSRLANGLFDKRYTDRIIEHLDDYKRYGINTFVVGIQGGNLQTGKNNLYPKMYNPDGTLDLSSVVWSNLQRLLDETDKRGQVLMIQYWYFLRDEAVPNDADALKTTRLVTQWLLATGHMNFIFDLANEFNHPAYTVPNNPNVKRPLFSTLKGALQLIQEVKRAMPNAIVGTSPPSGLASPEGFVGQQFVMSDLIIGHNTIADPNNPFSYRVGTIPANPSSKPYINNEFDAQLGSEKYPKKDPRTGRLTYGHFEQRSVTRYLNDLKSLRDNYGGYGNVFSSHQQFIPPNDPIPDPSVGPEGTQPEATSGGGEPSLHWLYSAIAGMRKFGSLETRHDFANGLASGFLLNGAGQWSVTGGRLTQTSASTPLAWSRMVTDTGDVEIAFDARFTSTPGSNQWLGFLLGDPLPAGPSYRVRIGAGRIELDQVGGSLAKRSVAVTRQSTDRYRFQLQDGRIRVFVGNRKVIDVADTNPIARRNLLFTTERIGASFDHIRTGPLRTTKFDDSTTGLWTAANPPAWSVPLRTGSPTDRVWRVTVPANGNEFAFLDRVIDDFAFDFAADLTGTTQLAFRFHVQDTTKAWGEGYTVVVAKNGTIRLERQPATGPAQTLATGSTTFANPADVRLMVAADGNRYQIRVVGVAVPVIDFFETAQPPLRDGALSFVAYPGTTSLDDFLREGGPSAIPTITMTKASGPPVQRGFKIVVRDRDGLLDLRGAALQVDLGLGFTDVTGLLVSVFDAKLGQDGQTVEFTLRQTLPIGSLRARVRAITFDGAGNRARTTVQFN